MRMFFLVLGIVEDGAVSFFSFEFVNFLRPELFFQWEFLFFGLRPIENWFFNESVCFFGLSHCGRRRRARFFIWIYNVFRTRINFSMRVLIFWGLRRIENWFFNESLYFLVSGLFKIVFEWQCLLFWSQALWKTVLCFLLFEFLKFLGLEMFFQWKTLFFWFQAYWKLIFQWKSLSFWI